MLRALISCKYSLVMTAFSMLLIFSCGGGQIGAAGQETETVHDDLGKMMKSISADIAKEGPSAWLRYFDSSAYFFMANNGSLEFKDFSSAKKFVDDTLVGMVQHVEINFRDIRIDPLSPGVAAIGAKYHEDTKDIQGSAHSYDGYFTGVAIMTSKGWKLRNLHWSE